MSARKREFAVIAFIVILLLSVMLLGTVGAEAAKRKVRIKSDGTIDPSSVPIQRSGNTYVFTADINAEIEVEKEGIVIDGAGYTLTGLYNGSQPLWLIGEGPNQTPTNETYSVGIDPLTSTITDLTIKNLNIRNFSIGMYLWSGKNTVTDCLVTDCIVGIMLQGNDHAVTRNYIADNKYGVFFGSGGSGSLPLNVTISGNSFVNNTEQLSGCVCKDYNLTENIHTWDDGSRGNYWSDYTGVDADGNSVGDTPYVIDVLNQDRYPLMKSAVSPPSPAPKLPVEIAISAAAVAAVALVAVAAVVVRRRRRKT